MHEQRPVVAAADVVLARPHQLDRAARADRLGDLRQLGRQMHVRLRAPAEAAAGQHGLDLHLLRLEAEHVGDGLVVAGLQLAAEARQRAAGRPSAGSRRAAPSAHAPDRGRRTRPRSPARRAASAASASPCCARDRAGLARQRAVLLDELLAAALLGGGLVPGDVQLLAALERRPRAVGVDGDAATGSA